MARALPKKIEDLIEDFTTLPGIGPKGAARIVFYLQKAPKEVTRQIADSMVEAKENISTCKQCFNLSEGELCAICEEPQRDRNTLIVVEDPLDLIAIERTGSFKGLYHVLGGIISPLNGIGPDEIRIAELINRLKGYTQKVEVILATNPNMEGESTALYIQNEIQRLPNKENVTTTRLARGLASGTDIDYTDDLTIRKALEGRTDM